MTSRLHQHELDDRETAGAYVAALATDLATIARQHGLDALGYILDMARLEAQNVSRAPPAPSRDRFEQVRATDL